MVVDSGADRTLLPRDLLGQLGLKGSADIAKDPNTSGGVRSKFVTWSSLVPLTAQIMLINQATGAATPWGPVISLAAGFAMRAPALAGRSDFFQPFYIVFQEGGAGANSEMKIIVR